MHELLHLKLETNLGQVELMLGANIKHATINIKSGRGKLSWGSLTDFLLLMTISLLQGHL